MFKPAVRNFLNKKAGFGRGLERFKRGTSEKSYATPIAARVYRISSDGAGSQRGGSGDGVEVAAGGGGTADPTSGTPLGGMQSAGLGPPAANEQEAPHVQQEEVIACILRVLRWVY